MTRISTTNSKRTMTVLISRRRRLCSERIAFVKILHLNKVNKALLLLILIFGCLVILYANSELLSESLFTFFLPNPEAVSEKITQKESETSQIPESNILLPMVNASHVKSNFVSKSANYNVFVIYTKKNYHLHMKFELFTRSMLKHATVRLHLHIITDKNSIISAEEVLQQQMRRFHRPLLYSLYDVHACAEQTMDIVNAMTPYFTSPKSYYSDQLFYLSLGLHRIADVSIDRAIILDCDIVFRSDIRLLFEEFDSFSADHLFGLAPELTPVYRHILYRYRANNPGTNFGSPYYYSVEVDKIKKSKSKLGNHLTVKQRHTQHGYPGLNSGVVLLCLNRIRESQLYHESLKEGQVQKLSKKYSFKGHLGDQDFFTLLGYEYPKLIKIIDCVWNRQLCTWWKDHGYSDIFDAYFHCEGKIQMYHGNCNTRVPE